VVDEAQEAPSRRTVRRDSRRIAAERSPEERRRRRLALIIIGAMLVVITGIVIAGYVIIFVLPPQQLIVRVNDVVYTRGDMVKLLRLRQRSMELSDTQGLRTSDDVFEALQLIVENEVIAQAAPSDGIAVSRDEIDNAVRARIAPSANESLGKSDAQIQREYHERYRQFLNQAQVSEAEHRDLVRKSILREKYRQFVGDQVPAFAEQVYLHRIAMSPNDEIDIMQTKLTDSIGDDNSPERIRGILRAIAREFSSDPETYQSAGNLGWTPLGIYEDYEDKFWDLEPGELSKPTPNMDNPQSIFFYVVSERDGNREVTRRNRETLKTRALQMWVNRERQNHDVYATFNSDIYAWFIEQLRISASTTPTPVTNPLQNILSGL
jgi:parvulin-like peptidyl-prolyl isomerase